MLINPSPDNTGDKQRGRLFSRLRTAGSLWPKLRLMRSLLRWPSSPLRWAASPFALLMTCILALGGPCRAQDADVFLPDPVTENSHDTQPNKTKAINKKIKPLQGGIEQREVDLSGDADETILQGGAGDEGWQMDAQHGAADQSEPLRGGAGDTTLSGGASDDPDAGNQELEIAWDEWRNRLLRAIQTNLIKTINVPDNVHFVWNPAMQMMQSRYPNGTSVWYSFSVLPNRKIIDIRLTQNSRFPSYDKAVIQSISALQGNKILVYPKGSKRRIVHQEANVSTSAESNFQNFNFGDVERQQW